MNFPGARLINYLDTDSIMYDLIFKMAEQEMQIFKLGEKIKKLRSDKLGLHTNVFKLYSSVLLIHVTEH